MNEQQSAAVVAQQLRTPLQSYGDVAKDKEFTKGGYRQGGYGVTVGAAVDGSHAFEGNQGYYAPGGKEIFLNTVAAMRAFFERHEKRGKAIRLVIKTGIGGQHTPFQGIADMFAKADPASGRIIGEYELGKDFEAAIDAQLNELKAGWDQLALIPSSKSGSTDETMVIFVQILSTMLKRALMAQGRGSSEAAKQTEAILLYFRTMNVPRDKQGAELFKGFSFDALASASKIEVATLKTLFKNVLGRMFFETTDKPADSRLSAFIRNSGLDKELGADAPGFGAMFENVGGRWTGDLHMMTFLAYYKLNAEAYWQTRRDEIAKVREGTHAANKLAHALLDNKITDIALKVPDELFWFGKSNEQNFNESIWQEGFANLVTVPESLWASQRSHYEGKSDRYILDLRAPTSPVTVQNMTSSKQDIASGFARLFSFFYGLTNTVGCRLIGRAVMKAGQKPDAVNMNDLGNAATKIVQENLFLRQPYVELGKGLVDEHFKKLQAEEQKSVGAIEREVRRVQAEAAKADAGAFAQALSQGKASGRKVVPFLYIEGVKFRDFRIALTKAGIEWVMQGTGDQHISYQQVLAQPKKYFVIIVSFLPEAGKELPGIPAVGFAKAHLDRISPHLLRDAFAEASYKALTDLRAAEGGQGVFIRLLDTVENRKQLIGQ